VWSSTSGYSLSTQNQQPYTKSHAQTSHDNSDRMDLTTLNTLEAMEYDAAEMDAEIAKLSY
jgi:hypothetical protein